MTEYNLCLIQGSDEVCTLVSADILSYTFENLNPETEYTIRISAINVFGEGPYSGVDFTTGNYILIDSLLLMLLYCYILHLRLAALPSLSGVQISSSSTSYEISWNEYVVPGATVEYYIVCFRRDQSSTECDKTVILPPSQLSYTISNDLGFGQYFVTVSPQTTEYGIATPTDSFTVLCPIDGIYCSAQSSSEISCSWDEYVVTDGTLSSYTLCLKVDPTTSSCAVLQGISPPTTNYTFTGLDSNTVYYPVILALTSFGFTLENVPENVTTFGSGK